MHRGGRGGGRGHSRGGGSGSFSRGGAAGAAPGRGGSSAPRGGSRGGRGALRGVVTNTTFAVRRTRGGGAGEGLDETFRIDAQRALADFRAAGDGGSITFPATLTNVERRFVHHQCGLMGLHSKSHGKGENRALTVQLKGSGGGGGGATIVHGPRLEAPRLNLSPGSEDVLTAFARRFPPELGEWCMGDRIEGIASAMAPFGSAGRRQGGGQRRTPSDASQRQQRDAWSAAASAREASREWPEVFLSRRTLPAWESRHALWRALDEGSRVIIVAGDTGCGKSTQVPQFILDSPSFGPSANIIVTQPRRISAISLAERVASERVESVGATVGYNVRLESASSASTRLLFVTTGVLLRRLIGDPTLADVTHVVLDEVHERDLHTDVLLVLLRNLVRARGGSLTLVIMSATIQLELFVDYFRAWFPGGGGDGGDGGTAAPQAHQLRARTGTLQPGAPPSPPPARMHSHPPVVDSHGIISTFIAGRGGVSIVHIAGCAFPVTRLYLEDVLDITGYGVAAGYGHTTQKPPSLLLEAASAATTTGVRMTPQTTVTQQQQQQQQRSVNGDTGGSTGALGPAGRSNDSSYPTASAAAAATMPAHAQQPTAPAPPSVEPTADAVEPTADAVEPTADAVEPTADAVEPGAPRPSDFVCGLCGRRSFVSAEAFGEHAALCFGPGFGDDDDAAVETSAQGVTPTSAAVGSEEAVPEAASVSAAAADSAHVDAATSSDYAADATVSPQGPVLPLTPMHAPRPLLLPGGSRSKQQQQQQHLGTDAGQNTSTAAATAAVSGASAESAARLDSYLARIDDESVDVGLLMTLLVHIAGQAFAAASHRGGPAATASGGPRSLLVATQLQQHHRSGSATPAPSSHALSGGSSAEAPGAVGGGHSSGPSHGGARTPLEAGMGAILVFLPGWDEISQVRYCYIYTIYIWTRYHRCATAAYILYIDFFQYFLALSC